MPILLKSPSRIEAFLYLYFVVLLVQALIERQIRRRMQTEGLPSLPLYPENRPCVAPTTNRIFSLFSDVRKHTLLAADGTSHRCEDSLSKIQCQLLELLDIDSRDYFGL